jgi:hypothetical protein
VTLNTAKAIEVAFTDTLAAFEDSLVVASEVEKFNLPGGPAQQAQNSDRVWRPVPYIPAVYDGFDQTSNFGDITRLFVPVVVGQHKVVPVKIGPKDGRDQDSVSRYFKDAGMSLASQVNLSVFTTAWNNATLISKRTVAASGYDDLAAMGAIMTEQGIPNFNRKAFYSARDYLAMAGTIAKPATSDSPLSRTAYERAYIKTVGNFDLFENDQTKILAAKTAATVTITNTAPLYYTPVADTADADGNTTNVDNRYQTISVAVGSGTLAVGDAFTIAGVNSVHHISKADTGQLKTFRVIAIVTGAGGTGTIKIAPPIISNGGSTRAELEYKNVSATPTNGAVITLLNTVAAPGNLFFTSGAIELIPGTYAVDPDDGWKVSMRGTTPKLGLPMTLVSQGEINDLTVKMRLETDYGTGALNPEMIGLQLFNQT